MRFRVIGRNEQTQSAVTREIVCDTESDAEAFAVFEGIVVERIEPLAESPDVPALLEVPDEAPPVAEPDITAPTKEPEAPPEFGIAPHDCLPAPLDDPLRALRWFLAFLMCFQTALMWWLIIRGERQTEVLSLSAGSILFTFAFWRLLPNRRVNAFYLRSFRHDADTWAMRKSLARALGPEFRLSGIRDPRRRSIKLLRYLSVFVFALRYVSPKFFEPGSWGRLETQALAFTRRLPARNHRRDQRHALCGSGNPALLPLPGPAAHLARRRCLERCRRMEGRHRADSRLAAER